MTKMFLAGHGPNIGHGWVKYVVIDEQGNELPPIVFPALVGPAGQAVAGSLQRVEVVEVDGGRYWVGDDALLSGSARTNVAQDRLFDPVFIPALLRAALNRFGPTLNGSSSGACVSGLPAAWSNDQDRGRALGARFREATSSYTTIQIVPEPLGLVYSLLLDNNGQIVGDPVLQQGRIAIIDLGHYTVDTIEIDRMRPVPNSLITYQLGTSRPLQRIRAHLGTHFERELTLYEVDQAIRSGGIRVAGRVERLPTDWDAPLTATGADITSRLVEAWGRGTQFEAILIGGGGAELEQQTQPIIERFRNAVVIPDAQLAIARGYAKLARRQALQQAGR